MNSQISAALRADLPPAPRTLDVFLNRAELARVAGVGMQRVYRSFERGELSADAMDAHSQPLFLMQRLPQLKAILEKSNAEIAA